jgi:hypothetical protein
MPLAKNDADVSHQSLTAASAEINARPRKESLMSDKQSAQAKDPSLKTSVDALLVELGVEPISYTCGTLVAKITGEIVAHVREVDAAGATSAMRFRKDRRLRSSPTICARPKPSCRREAPIAASPM